MRFDLPKIRSGVALARAVGEPVESLHWLANARTHGNRKDSTHYRNWWTRKRSGGWRLIESPLPRLKQVQRELLPLVFDRIEPHPLSFGFCKGRSVIDFAKPHVKQSACLKLDLRDFFSQVTTGRVFGLLRKMGFCREVSHLIALLTTVRTDVETLSVGHPDPSFDIREPALRKRHLPQGAPTSPVIANMCAFGLDVRLSGLARSVGAHYSRYADDILISGDHDFARQAHRLKTVAGTIALEEGFEINFRKTRLLRSSQRQFVAGMVLNEGTNLPRVEFDRLKAILHNCVRHGHKSQNRDSHPRFREHLEGRVRWVETVNATKGAKLRILFDQIVWV